MSYLRASLPFEMVRPSLSEHAGFHLDFMEYDRNICFADPCIPGLITAHLVSGKYRTVLELHSYSIAMQRNEREMHDLIFQLLADGIRDIQGQYHHENDYQLAVQLMAAEAVN